MLRAVPGLFVAVLAALSAAGSAGAQTPRTGDGGVPAAPPPGTSSWVQKYFINPPLKCFAPYTRIDEFPMMAWCFHGGKPAGRFAYNDQFALDAKAFGFNVLIDSSNMLEPCHKASLKLVVPVFQHEAERLKDTIFRNNSDHPALMGLVLDDNCPRIYPAVVSTARWLTQAYPHVVPWISENPNPRDQSRTPLRILGTQNYAFLRGGVGQGAVQAYCNQLNYDRVIANANNMSAWVLFGGHNAFSEIRFQEMAALAYGVQGLVCFAYTPHRTKIYEPGNPATAELHRLHRYVVDVVGRHLWGTRCLDVLHSTDGGAHTGATRFESQRPVVKASDTLLVGLLTPEHNFLSSDPADRMVPEYFLIVDKRTGQQTPPARDLFVMLHPGVPAVELLHEQALASAPIRRIVPGWKVRARLEGGQGLLLRAPPGLERLLGGREGLAIYVRIANAMGDLQRQIDPPAGFFPTPPRPRADEVARTVAAAKADLALLERALSTDVKAGAITAAQAADTLAALLSAIDATADEAVAPPPPPATAPAKRPPR